MCGEAIGDEHRHVVDVESAACCAPAGPATCCSPTTGPAGGTVPRGARPLPARDPGFGSATARLGRAADPGRRWRSSSSTRARPGRSRSTRARPGPPSPCSTSTLGRRRRRATRWSRARAGRRGAARPPRPSGHTSASSCRSTPATSWSAWSGCTGGASTAGQEARRAHRRLLRRRLRERGRGRRGTGSRPMAELAFDCLDVRADRYAAGPDADLPAAHRRDHRRAGARDRAALPDPHRAAQAPLRRRRGGPARRPVRRRVALGRHAQADPVRHRRRRWCPASPAATEVDLPVPCTLRPRGRGHQYFHALERRRGPAAAAVQRHGLHQGRAGLRGRARCRGTRRRRYRLPVACGGR